MNTSLWNSAGLVSMLAIAATLSACTPSDGTATSQASSASSVSSQAGRMQAKEGELCGGIAGIACESGLTCRNQASYPDAAGTCER
jgi:hypothetical protein